MDNKIVWGFDEDGNPVYSFSETAFYRHYVKKADQMYNKDLIINKEKNDG